VKGRAWKAVAMGQGKSQATKDAIPQQSGGDEPARVNSADSTGSTDSGGPAMTSCLKASDFRKRTVNLHIYDVRGNFAIEYMNTLFRMLGTGAFHVAVEVCGDEWSYGFVPKPDGCTGVFNCAPGQNKNFGHHRETLIIGETPKTVFEIDNILDVMVGKWFGQEYDLLRHNCCNFCDELCRELGVGGIPQWVMNLAHVGSSISDGVWKILETPHHVLFETAKAGSHEPPDHSTPPRKSHSGLHYAEKLDDAELKVHASSGRDHKKERRQDTGCLEPEPTNEAPQRRRCCCLTPSKGSG